MSEYVRVRDRATGHEYTIRADLAVDGLEVLEKPALGRDRLPRPPKYRTPLGESAHRRTAKKKAAPAPDPVVPDLIPDPDPTGQTAESEQENH